jgi:hypothetical protein
MVGNFSDADIQELLGAISPEEAAAATAHTNHDNLGQTTTATNANSSGKSSPVISSTTSSTTAPDQQESRNTTANTSNRNGAIDIDDESKVQARSERKRSREKQRRVDVNKQFSDLTKLITDLEKEERDEDPSVFRQAFASTNRADLIARTISHLERLRDVSKKRRTEIGQLQQRVMEAQKAGEDTAQRLKDALCNNSHNQMMMPQPNKQVSLDFEKINIISTVSHLFVSLFQQ